MRPGPGCAGSSVPVVTGAVASPVGAPIVNVTVLAASTLPATSVDRYSTEYAPAAVNAGLLAGSYVTHSAAAASSRAAPNAPNGLAVLTWYSVSATPDVASAPGQRQRDRARVRAGAAGRWPPSWRARWRRA